MSTITKLDSLVRLQRSKRREERMRLQKDLRELDSLLKRGYVKLNRIDSHPASKANPLVALRAKAPIKLQINDLFKARVLCQLTLNHITKIGRDPKRTGYAKDCILEKLSA